MEMEETLSRLVHPSNNKRYSNNTLKNDLKLLITNFLRNRQPWLSDEQIEEIGTKLREACKLPNHPTTSKCEKTSHNENETKRVEQSLEHVFKVNKAYVLRLKRLKLNASKIIPCKRKSITPVRKLTGSLASKSVNGRRKSLKSKKVQIDSHTAKSKPKQPTPTEVKLQKTNNLSKSKQETSSKILKENTKRTNGGKIPQNVKQNTITTARKVITECASKRNNFNYVTESSRTKGPILENVLRLDSKNNYRKSKSNVAAEFDDLLKSSNLSFVESIKTSRELNKLNDFCECYLSSVNRELTGIARDLDLLQMRHKSTAVDGLCSITNI